MITPPLTYCTNVHPGETWDEIIKTLQIHLPAIKTKAGYTHKELFPIGLRLSAQAVDELLRHPKKRIEFSEWMQEKGFELFTMNGFPYGTFHGTRVKENVFLPDWSAPERLAYTQGLFTLLHEWADPGRDISVSTLPGSHKTFKRKNTDLIPFIREMGHFLEKLAQETGRDCHLGFEPEPLGHFDNTAQSIGFLEQVFCGQKEEDALRKRLGITYDTCHFALQYESPAQALSHFARAGIRISKIQASNALALDPREAGALDKLKSFDEPVYFHQVAVKEEDNSLRLFSDLEPALKWAATQPSPGVEWRCHFHIPIGASPNAPLRDTNDHLIETISYQKEHPELTAHWEAETYTWGVLPPELRTDLDEQISRELLWLKDRFR